MNHQKQSFQKSNLTKTVQSEYVPDIPVQERRKGTVLMAIGTLMLMVYFLLLFRSASRDAELERLASKTVETIKQSNTSRIDGDLGMPVVICDGHEYIGFLTIEHFSSELPVMSTWSDERLKISPCRYYGFLATEDLVLAAHNYVPFFGRLKHLVPGDSICFTSVDGQVVKYMVAEIEVLSPFAVNEMIYSDYPLTLFTCTDDEVNRLTVRCVAAG